VELLLSSFSKLIPGLGHLLKLSEAAMALSAAAGLG